MKALDRVIGGRSFPGLRIWAVLAEFLAAGAVALAQAPPDKIIVADVIPQGLVSVPPQKIMGLIKTRPGAEYKPEVVADDVKRLYETRSFANVQVVEKKTDDGKVIIYFQLAEMPSVIQEIVYLGARHISKDDLESVTGLRKGAPLNPLAVQLARTAILRKYEEKGRLSASVEILEGNRAGDTRVVFNITEGPAVKVGHIDFVGNTFVTGERLRTQVNSSRAFLGILGGEYNPLMADLDVSKLENYYRGFGFHDVRVGRELVWDASQRKVNLIFHVYEGKRYRVASVDVSGVSEAERDQLMRFNSIKVGDQFNQQKIDIDRNKMKDSIGNDGHDATVQVASYYPENRPGQVVLNYEVQEKPVARVGQIIPVGNQVTKQNVILRQVPLYPGQILTYPDLRLAEANLAKLNIFETNPEKGIRPTVTVIDPDSDSVYKDILVNVQETQTGSLLFGIGVNSDAGLTGSIVLNERNFDITRPPESIEDSLSGRAFRGAGEEFRIEAVPGTELQRYTISFREPYLFDSQFSLGASVYYWQRQYNEDLEERVGTRWTLGHKLNKYWTASGTLRVEGIGIHDVASDEPEDYQSVIGENFLVGIGARVTRDTRDSYLRATEGSMIDFSFEECLGSYTFPLVNFEANKYFTVYQRADGSGRHVVAFRSQIGWAGDETPVYERFFAGGFRSMRGFEFRGVGPATNGFETGGDFMFLNSVEYQVPIRANDNIYLVAFVDSGTVEQNVEITDYRVSAGVGARITVPMLGPVPIALDFGFPIVRASEDKTQIFSFWVGFFR